MSKCYSTNRLGRMLTMKVFCFRWWEKDLIKYKGYQVCHLCTSPFNQTLWFSSSLQWDCLCLHQVAPAELEDLLHSHPDIVDAAVIPYVTYSTVLIMIWVRASRANSSWSLCLGDGKWWTGTQMRKQVKYPWPSSWGTTEAPLMNHRSRILLQNR